MKPAERRADVDPVVVMPTAACPHLASVRRGGATAATLPVSGWVPPGPSAHGHPAPARLPVLTECPAVRSETAHSVDPVPVHPLVRVTP